MDKPKCWGIIQKKKIKQSWYLSKPLGMAPASMKVARLKLATTKKVTIPSHSGISGEMFT